LLIRQNKSLNMTYNSAIDFLLKSEEKRLEMSGKGISIIDGKGSDRVARCMAFGEC